MEPFQATMKSSCDCFPLVDGKRPCDLAPEEVPDFPGKKPAASKQCTACRTPKKPADMYDWTAGCPLVPNFPAMRVNKRPADCKPEEVPDFPGRCVRGGGDTDRQDK